MQIDSDRPNRSGVTFGTWQQWHLLRRNYEADPTVFRKGSWKKVKRDPLPKMSVGLMMILRKPGMSMLNLVDRSTASACRQPRTNSTSGDAGNGYELGRAHDMTHEEAERGIVAAFKEWCLENRPDHAPLKTPDGLAFYDWLMQKRSELLTFQASGNKLRLVLGWLRKHRCVRD
jgi:hypothetical protein